MSKIDQLNELLLELSTSAQPLNALLLEHLESARSYLSGAMPREYRTSLAMARKQLQIHRQRRHPSTRRRFHTGNESQYT
jgi:hypothetical protein